LRFRGLAYESLSKKSDTKLVDYLAQSYGVGRWTVEIILICTFDRKDIFPIDDAGIQKAMRRIYRPDREGKSFK
jgi:DNA-3-methyladenine glycosylase II